MQTTEKHTLRTVHDAVTRRVDFKCNGTLTGFAGGNPLSGRLPVAYLKDFAHACSADDFYVVMSYATPIAWFANGHWTIPDVKYSATTSRHMSATRLRWSA